MIFQPAAGCVPYNPQSRQPYGYKPPLSVAIAFLALFCGSLAFHLYRTIKLRRITSVFFSAAACAECVGWIGRTMASSCPYRRDTFMVQMVAFTIAPFLILVGGILTLRLFMLHTAHHPKNLSPNACFFLLAALLLPSTALRLSGAIQTILDLEPGPAGMGPILSIGGYVLEVFIIFTIFFFLLFHSPDKAQLNSGFQMGKLPVALAIAVSTLALLVHSVYHIATNIQGWKGSLFSTQVYFVGFDATTMFVAVVVYNIFDPTVMLGSTYHHMSNNDETEDFEGRSAPVVMHRGTPFEMFRSELAG